MKQSLFLISFALVAAYAIPFVFAHERIPPPINVKADPIALNCALVTSHTATNVVSKRLLDAASAQSTMSLMHACTTAGRIMVSKTTVPLRGKVANRRTAESGMFSVI